MLLLSLLLLLLPPPAPSLPQFDPTALLSQTLIPADAAPNSVIYRLRAFDPSISYPLHFTLAPPDPLFVSIDTLNCSRLNSICHANVVLRQKLEAGRFYDFTVLVENRRGEGARLNCSFRATNATTPIGEIFPGAPTLLMVREDARRNTELGTIIARGREDKEGVVMELWGAPQFGLHQRLINRRDAQATVVLLAPLDYETKTVHHLTILANDPWTNPLEDTRNIAPWSLLVTVLDVQDTPPTFTLAPPTTTLSPALLPGDLILRVHAEDGDRGSPRDIRYGLVPEGNPFTSFFSLSEDSGELRLAKPLSQIMAIAHANQPIVLTVLAEEVRREPSEPPAQASTVKLALIPPGAGAGSTVFGASEYSALLDENSGVGTVLELAQAQVSAEAGTVVELSLSGDNGTFDVRPRVVHGQGKFEVTVRDPSRLDYEQYHSLHCFITAKEVGPENYTTSAKLQVLINDINDNPPKFLQDVYEAQIQESAPFGTSVVRVEAVDPDFDHPTQIRYTKLSKEGNAFDLDMATGVITVSNPLKLDAEVTPSIQFYVEAADENGAGLTSTATVIVDLIDVNDESPQFEKPIYEFIINQGRNGFTTPAFIKAFDRDISFPNNDVRYELIKPVDGLVLDELSGELTLTKILDENNIIVTSARAYDGGIPRLFNECEIRIYPSDTQSRKMVFIVPGKNPDPEVVRKQLSVLTGGRVSINEIRPYLGAEPGAKDVAMGTHDKSVVVATITYSDSIIDVNTVRQVFDVHQTPISVSKSGNLLWLLILLLILALLLALTLVLCCICQGCPLYVPPKRKKVSAHIQKIVQGSGLGKESKSVQVAEWFGRREAWTPEVESLRRHEQERGSDRTEVREMRRTLRREPSREQLYIREGNADILRLITRGNEPIYVTETGKDILMKRFIDQQSETTQMDLPNAVTKLQSEHEMLEASLKQHTALLQQILQDRERDLRLETQSLPAGTQTDQDQCTQTDPLRKVRSDNDASDSDDEIVILRAKARRRRVLKRLKTPIQEESEEDKSAKQNEMRIRKARRKIREEVLREISASLQKSESEKEFFSDSLEATPRAESGKQFHSENDLTKAAEKKEEKIPEKQETKKKKKGQPRYMEWYNKKSGSEKNDGKVVKTDEKIVKSAVKSRLMQETESSARKKVDAKHPLLQHSEYRFEPPYHKIKKRDEDVDSGIALARLPIAQKKSVFTIAYNDMHTSQLRPDSHSN